MTRPFKELNVSIQGKVRLKGTVTLPVEVTQQVPAVLILAGSGPIDRDGNIQKQRLNLNIYKDLSHMIAKMGFATLRYDKRGTGASGGDFWRTGMWDLVEDAEAALQFLTSHPQVDETQTIVLGHSEGCVLATAISARQARAVQGLVLLAGSAETLEEALAYQRSLVYKELNALKGLKGVLVRLLKVPERAEKQAQAFIQNIMHSHTDTLKYKLKTVNAKWYREHFAYNVLEDLKKIECPTLAVTGSKDAQANPDRVPKFVELIGDRAEYRIIDNMNHILRKQEADVSVLQLTKEYKRQSGQPLHPELQHTLSEWLQKHFGR